MRAEDQTGTKDHMFFLTQIMGKETSHDQEIRRKCPSTKL